MMFIIQQHLQGQVTERGTKIYSDNTGTLAIAVILVYATGSPIVWIHTDYLGEINGNGLQYC